MSIPTDTQHNITPYPVLVFAMIWVAMSRNSDGVGFISDSVSRMRGRAAPAVMRCAL
jgi:hypothetical protein